MESNQEGSMSAAWAAGLFVVWSQDVTNLGLSLGPAVKAAGSDPFQCKSTNRQNTHIKQIKTTFEPMVQL